METKDKNSKPSPVSFVVFRSDGSKNPDILKYFLERMHIGAVDAVEGVLTLQDGTRWTLVLEPQVKEALKQTDNCQCLVSFQARRHGNFAVARLYNPNYKANKGH